MLLLKRESNQLPNVIGQLHNTQHCARVLHHVKTNFAKEHAGADAFRTHSTAVKGLLRRVSLMRQRVLY